MGKVKLLDCTLRDGGYLNDWQFGNEAITDTIEKMTQSGVEIFEIGFLRDEQPISGRTVYCDVHDINKVIAPKNRNVFYTAMAEVSNPLPIEKLAPADENTIDAIRVIVWKRMLKEGYEYCKQITDLGYQLCIQPARVDQYSDEEFSDMVKMYAELHPYAIYVVDSWGTQRYNSIKHYIELADALLSEDIAIGFHGHNNLMQTEQTAEMFVEMELQRDIIIDASIYGIGRGAGNLNIELFAKYMNDKHGTNYDISPMIQLYDQHYWKIYMTNPWGYSLPFYLTAKYNCNPNYASYYGHECHVSAADIEGVLKNLSDEDRVLYTDAKAKKCLSEYLHKKARLAVVIPTANNDKAIDSWLYTSASGLKYHGVDIIIYDSSDDEKTEAVVRNFQIDGYDNVIYERYTGKADRFLLDHKVISAYENFNGKYEYLWLCLDDFILYPEQFDHIIQLIDKENDLIIVNAKFRDFRKLGNHQYTDIKLLFKEQCAQMTILGATIIKSETLKKILTDVPLIEGKTYGLWQPISFFIYFADKHIKAESFVGQIMGYNSAAQARSFLKSTEMRQWCEIWYHNIMSLPNCYNNYKEEVLKIEMSDFHPFSRMELLRMRAVNTLKVADVKKYRKIIPHVCITSIRAFYFIAMLPKNIAKYLSMYDNGRISRILKKILRIIGGELPEEKELIE